MSDKVSEEGSEESHERTLEKKRMPPSKRARGGGVGSASQVVLRAVRTGNISALSDLVAAGAFQDYTLDVYLRLAHEACAGGRARCLAVVVAECRKRLETAPISSGRRDGESSLLHFTVMSGLRGCFAEVLRFDPAAAFWRDGRGMTPLHRACFLGDDWCVGWLLHARRRGLLPLTAWTEDLVNARVGTSGHGSTPLIAACCSCRDDDRDVATIRLLLEADARWDLVDADDDCALTCACVSRAERVVGLLLSHGATVECMATTSGEEAWRGSRAPIDRATRSREALDHDERLLPDEWHERNGLVRESTGTTPLHVTLRCSGDDGQARANRVLRRLLVAKLDLRVYDELAETGETQLTPLHVACRHGNAGAVALLLQGGACPRTATRALRRTPLHACVGSAAAVGLLVAAGADVDARDALGQTAVQRALERHDAGVVCALLESGASVAVVEAMLCLDRRVVAVRSEEQKAVEKRLTTLVIRTDWMREQRRLERSKRSVKSVGSVDSVDSRRVRLDWTPATHGFFWHADRAVARDVGMALSQVLLRKFPPPNTFPEDLRLRVLARCVGKGLGPDLPPLSVPDVVRDD